MPVLPIIESVEGEIIDVEEVEISELENAIETFQFRRYLYALLKKEAEVNRICDAKKQIVERYDSVIKAKKAKIDNFKGFLKDCLVLSEKFKTKTGGYKVEIPDVGNFSATKPVVSYVPGQAYLDDESFYYQPAPVFDEKAFDEFVLNKIDSGEWAMVDTAIVDTKTGEIVPDISVSTKRRYTFPKGENHV